MTVQSHEEKSIFRPEALAKYHQRESQAVLPKFAQPGLFPKLWISSFLLMTCMGVVLGWPKTQTLTFTGTLSKIRDADPREWEFEVIEPSFWLQATGQRALVTHQIHGTYEGVLTSVIGSETAVSSDKRIPQTLLFRSHPSANPDFPAPPTNTPFHIKVFQPELSLIDLILTPQSTSE